MLPHRVLAKQVYVKQQSFIHLTNSTKFTHTPGAKTTHFSVTQHIFPSVSALCGSIATQKKPVSSQSPPGDHTPPNGRSCSPKTPLPFLHLAQEEKHFQRLKSIESFLIKLLHHFKGMVFAPLKPKTLIPRKQNNINLLMGMPPHERRPHSGPIYLWLILLYLMSDPAQDTVVLRGRPPSKPTGEYH